MNFYFLGIKNIRFPPAAAKPAPTPVATVQKPSVNTDDDVIFISPPTSPTPTPKVSLPPHLSHVTLPSSLSIIRKPNPNEPVGKPTGVNSNQTTAKSDQTTNSTASVNKPPEVTIDRPKTFLRVKSLTALQNVPSECITIPDDPLPPPPPLTPIQGGFSAKTDPNNTKNMDIVEIFDDAKDNVNDINNDNFYKPSRDSVECMTFNLKEPYLHAVKNLRIVIAKSTELEEMVKNKFDKMNCDTLSD